MGNSIDALEIEFPKGPFSEIVAGLVLYKRSLGYKYDDGRLYVLRRIAAELNASQLDGSCMPEEAVMRIQARRDGEARETQVVRTTLLRQLALYMNMTGREAYVLPPETIKYDKTVFKAFIMTREEIDAIVAACDDRCEKSASMSRSAKMVYPAFVRTLYCCALRLSEARKLMTDDVDIEGSRIYIRKSKHNRSRYVPLSGSLAEYLGSYAESMAAAGLPLDDGPFFPSPSGGIYSKHAVSQVLNAVIRDAVQRKTSKGTCPRIHDLRHSAAVHMVEAMEEAGYDLRAMLPALSDLLGHAALWETEQYLQLPGYAFGKISELEGVNSIIPEVDDGEL